MITKRKLKTDDRANLFTNALIMLWVYASVSKLIIFQTFRHQLLTQHFDRDFAKALAYLLPSGELIIAVLLLFGKTRLTGQIFSALLLLIFSIYIIAILLGPENKVPCSCGGVLEYLGWKSHLAFNLTFLSVNIFAIRLTIKRKEAQAA
ncbi:MAG: hypothetical protein EOO01_01925 [Chitinophagaceae bacterium]|nr:MAG: hypothetical protein EOO01_01925 [Chitinophagaceae bacterium]